MANNKKLHTAKKVKNDEFYTQLMDIENEVQHYQDFFKDKVVMCNCDDPLESNFTKYFILNFHYLGLKKLISTFYDINGGKAFVFEYEGQDMNNDCVIDEKDINILISNRFGCTPLSDDDGFDIENKDECWDNGIYGSGDFRSKNVISYLKQADVVVTNPPFSLFREYIAQLIEYEKKFLVIGHMNAITYKEIFKHIQNNKLWCGYRKFSGGMDMIQPKSTFDETKTKSYSINDNGQIIKNIMGCIWFTNIEHKKRNAPIDLYKTYSVEKYPKYDNYDAIEVSEVSAIPKDYDGVMGVPITFLGKYCPTQFQIVGLANNVRYIGDFPCLTIINGQKIYNRLLIKRVS